MADRQLAPIEAVRSAGTAKEGRDKRFGLELRGIPYPKGIITVKFNIETGFRALSIAACKKTAGGIGMGSYTRCLLGGHRAPCTCMYKFWTLTRMSLSR